VLGKYAGRSWTQLSGVGSFRLARWTVRLPAKYPQRSAWPTDWDFAPRNPSAGGHSGREEPDGSVNIFRPQGLNRAGRVPPNGPGESGRATPSGEMALRIDLGLGKRWTMPWKESQSLQFRWEVFNVLNLTRFDVQTITRTSMRAAHLATTAAFLQTRG